MSDTCSRLRPLRDLAKALDCSLPTARKLVRDGKVPAVQVGRNLKVTDDTLHKVADLLRVQPTQE